MGRCHGWVRADKARILLLMVYSFRPQHRPTRTASVSFLKLRRSLLGAHHGFSEIPLLHPGAQAPERVPGAGLKETGGTPVRAVYMDLYGWRWQLPRPGFWAWNAVLSEYGCSIHRGTRSFPRRVSCGGARLRIRGPITMPMTRRREGLFPEQRRCPRPHHLRLYSYEEPYERRPVPTNTRSQRSDRREAGAILRMQLPQHSLRPRDIPPWHFITRGG